MKLSKNLLVLAVLAMAVDCLSQGSEFSKTYKPGMKLYVHAIQGLSMRASADLKAKVLTTVPFGGEVEVLSDSNPKVAITNSNIAGTWVKVKLGANSGYMFDGFLSRMKTMTRSNNKPLKDQLRDFFKSQYKVTSETDKIPAGETLIDYRKIVFLNGVIIETKSFEGGVFETVYFPVAVLTYQETYLFARVAYPEFFSTKPCDYNPEHLNCSMDEGMTNLQLKREGSSYVLSFSFGD